MVKESLAVVKTDEDEQVRALTDEELSDAFRVVRSFLLFSFARCGSERSRIVVRKGLGASCG